MIAAIVVSDTSPLRALAHLGQVELLGRFFGRVLVPPAVAEELRQARPMLPSLDLSPWPFIEVRAVADLSGAMPYISELHAGEAQALALAIEVGATHLLIDESQGRKMARAAGLVPLGVLGLLVRAKKAGIVQNVGPLVDRLRTEIRFHVSQAVQEAALREAGEMA